MIGDIAKRAADWLSQGNLFHLRGVYEKRIQQAIDEATSELGKDVIRHIMKQNDLQAENERLKAICADAFSFMTTSTTSNSRRTLSKGLRDRLFAATQTEEEE